MAAFPKAKSLGAGEFRVKNETQNRPTELAQLYGMAAADIGNDIGKRGRKGGLALALGDRSKACSS